ncbi:hypothetical protein O6H91_03G076100 [Diphasiastrum complanatum]|uniref:Uncharacterized protein n=1 Tax=Diphasiastrum complanatum TaxID=34168 RepID=A0ACC2E7Y9_DIPCM|nr:hypothetical protein O6H91_03G076100 [Diphasiastrum complanatum]
MQRSSGPGGSGSSNGSSGKGSSNRNVAGASGSRVHRSPRAPLKTDGLASATSQRKSYELPEPRTPPGGRNPLGKHRLRAEGQRLKQEIHMLQEFKAADKTPPASRACRELVEFMETCADPLLPVTTGPISAEWDRWFRQPVEPSQCCWCLGSFCLKSVN